MLAILRQNLLKIIGVGAGVFDHLGAVGPGVGDLLLRFAGQLRPEHFFLLLVDVFVPQRLQKLVGNGAGGLAERLFRVKFGLADGLFLCLDGGVRRLEGILDLPGNGYAVSLNGDDPDAAVYFVELVLKQASDVLGYAGGPLIHRLFDAVIDHRPDDGVGEEVFQQGRNALLDDIAVVLSRLEPAGVHETIFEEAFGVGNLVGEDPLRMKDVIIAALGDGGVWVLFFARGRDNSRRSED